MSHPFVSLGVRLHSFASLRHAERGASLVEYALLLALIAMVCIAAVATFGSHTSNSFKSAAGLL